MNPRILLLPPLLASMSAIASADIIQPGYKRIEPVVAFEGLDDYPAYRFYLFKQISAGGPVGPAREAITDSKPFVPKWGAAAGRCYLLAIPKGVSEKDLEPEHRGDFPACPGLISCELKLPPTYGLVSQPDRTFTRFQVKIKDGKLVAPGEAELPPQKPGTAEPKSSSSIFYGLSIALLAVAIGMVFSRRLTGNVA